MITFTYDYTTEKIIVLFPYDPNTVMQIKDLNAYAHYENTLTRTLDGVKTVKKFKHWRMDVNQENVKKLSEETQNKNFQIDERIFSAWEVTQEFKKRNLYLSTATETETHLQPRYENLESNLPRWQVVAIEYIRRNSGGVLLADENYLNPELESLLAIETGEMYPVLIVCPEQKKFTWASKLKRHFAHRKFEILDENKNNVTEATSTCIVSYPHVEQSINYLNLVPWKTLVCDDYRHINDYNDKRTKIIIDLAKEINNRIVISYGLDISKPKTLISFLQMTGKINEFGGFWSFVNRYCGAKITPFGHEFNGNTHTEELENKIRELFCISRTKAQVFTDKPL